MPPFFPLTLSLYAVTCTLAFLPLLGAVPALPSGEASKTPFARGARLILLLAFVSHTVDIGWLCYHGRNPVVDAREATFFACWLLAGLYLVALLRGAGQALGALLVPVILVLSTLAQLTPNRNTPGVRAVNVSLLAIGHILAATLGSAIFIVAAGASALYLWQERQLKNAKQRRVPLVPRRGISLEGLDTLNRRCVALGFPVFTAALLTGTVWVGMLPPSASSPYAQPQYVFAVLTWLVYALLMLARLTAGVRGRRAALATLAGFATTMMVLLLYLFRGVTR